MKTGDMSMKRNGFFQFAVVAVFAMGWPCKSLVAQHAKLAEIEYSRSPMQFLQYLEATHRKGTDPNQNVVVEQSNKGKHPFFIPEAPLTWIGIEDAIELFKFVHDETPCSGIQPLLSAQRSVSNSTIAMESRRLIQGYLTGYPPVGPTGSVDQLEVQVLSKAKNLIQQNTRERRRILKTK